MEKYRRRYLRIGCSGEILEVTEKKQQEDGKIYTEELQSERHVDMFEINNGS
jgi:transposase-like protein